MCWCRVIWTYICISFCNNCNIFTTLNTFLTGPNNNKPGQVRTVNKRRFTIDRTLKNMSASQNFPMATFHHSHSSLRVREVGKQFPWKSVVSWWRHQMETFSALLAICAGNSPATGEFPAQRPVTRSFDVFCDLCLNKRLRKQSWDWWFETLSRPLWRHCDDRYCSWLFVLPLHGLTSICKNYYSSYLSCFTLTDICMWNWPRKMEIICWCILVFYIKSQHQDGHEWPYLRFQVCGPRKILTYNFEHDDVMIWKRFPHQCPFVREFHCRFFGVRLNNFCTNSWVTFGLRRWNDITVMKSNTYSYIYLYHYLKLIQIHVHRNVLVDIIDVQVTWASEFRHKVLGHIFILWTLPFDLDRRTCGK